MKAVQPQMAMIKERYADDKTKQQQAMMELYKKEQINPLAGCLPIAIHAPASPLHPPAHAFDTSWSIPDADGSRTPCARRVDILPFTKLNLRRSSLKPSPEGEGLTLPDGDSQTRFRFLKPGEMWPLRMFPWWANSKKGAMCTTTAQGTVESARSPRRSRQRCAPRRSPDARPRRPLARPRRPLARPRRPALPARAVRLPARAVRLPTRTAFGPHMP